VFKIKRLACKEKDFFLCSTEKGGIVLVNDEIAVLLFTVLVSATLGFGHVLAVLLARRT
jgi:hypothetical protein